ncbi:MAG: hypothetical protein P4M11_11480 [Candidatus Pacebacteria bacterium]|nr:hypothetical protein [Candidatus Paceibacterota bacterium]
MSTSATTGTNTALNSFITTVETQILTPIITLLALGAFIVFVWGVVEYIRNADNDEARKLGQQHILWGLIGLVIIFGANALVTLIGNIANQIF